MRATGISTRRTVLTAMMACAVMMLGTIRPTAAAAPQQALQHAPDRVDAVLVVPDMAALSARIAELKQALGLPMPELDDALGAFKQATGMTAGLDDNGAMLVVFPDLAEAIAAEREPAVVLLAPVTDYNAFVGNFGGNGDEAVTALTMPGTEQAFGRKVDGYAVLGETREAVEGYAAGNAGGAIVESIGQLGQKYLGEAEALVYVNLETLAPTLLPLVDKGLAEATRQLDQAAEMGAIDEQTLPQMKAVYSLYADAARVILRDANAWMGAVDLNDGGIGFTETLSYKAGSQLAQIFPQREGRPAALAALPDQPYIFSVAVDMQAVAIASLSEQVAKAMAQGENAFMPDPELWLPMMRNLNGFAMAFYAPNDMALMSGNFLNTLTVLDVNDADQYLAALKKYVTGLNGFEVPVAAPMAGLGEEPEPMKISYSTTYNEGALQLDGVKVDQFQVTTNMPPQMMQQMGPAAGFMKAFTNYGGYVAARDGKVLMTTVIDPQLVTKGFEAIDQGNGLGGAESLTRVRDAALPPDPVAEAYVSLSGIAQTANIAMGMFGMPPIEAPADLPPIAMGLATEENSLAFRAYLPMESLKFVVQTGQNIAMMMGGGPGGPGGGMQPGPGGPPPF